MYMPLMPSNLVSKFLVFKQLNSTTSYEFCSGATH